MDNYIVINGKKAELTEEQLKQLGISVEVKKEIPFTRYPDKQYWSINAMNVITVQHDCNDNFDNATYEVANYFNDYEFAEQVALHQLLYRKLLKYAYENDAADCDWTDPDSSKYFVTKNTYDNNNNKFCVNWNHILKHSCVIYFNSAKVAEQAIEDVVKPFMEEHPDFVW